MTILLFWTALFFMGYTFVGYPISLYILDKIKNDTKSDQVGLSVETNSVEQQQTDYTPSVDVILIVRNVENIINEKLQSLLALDYPSDKLNIIIVSDQSDDNTVKTIESHNSTRITCINNNHKSSKSACLNQAIALSEAEILLMTDARQKHEPNSLNLLVEHFKDSSVGAVSGELVLLDPETNQFAIGMDAYWRYEKFIRNLESRIASVPGVTGAIYAMRRADFKPIPDDTLLDDVLIPMNMVLNGKKVLFDKRAIAYDIPSADPTREKIRKTRTLAGNWQLLEFEPQLLNPFRNKIWWQFISHKILRLFAPMYLVIIFLASFIASGHYYLKLIFLAQVAGYLIVGLSYFNPTIRKLPLVSIAQSFMTLMWFTVLGFWSFATRKHLAIWK